MSGAKTKRLNIRLTEEEYDRMRQEAENASLSVSDYVLGKTIYDTNQNSEAVKLANCFDKGIKQLSKRLEALEKVIEGRK
jgi:uncharacterized protein (DUF1778 family)